VRPDPPLGAHSTGAPFPNRSKVPALPDALVPHVRAQRTSEAPLSQDKPSQAPHELRALYRRWAFLDLETTGLTEPIGVVQVGIEVVDFDGEAGPLPLARLSICVDPGQDHEPGALQVHGMAADDLVMGRPAPLTLHGVADDQTIDPLADLIDPVVQPWAEAASAATAWLAALRPEVVACWGDYDFLVLEGLAGRDAPTIELPAVAYVDLRAVYKEHFGAATPQPSTRLASAAKAFGLGDAQTHRAVSDAQLARLVFDAMADAADASAALGAA
jgi:DNA polymerase III epsilon subunit-like protein